MRKDEAAPYEGTLTHQLLDTMHTQVSALCFSTGPIRAGVFIDSIYRLRWQTQ